MSGTTGRRRASAGDMTFTAPTAPTRADASADARPDVRAPVRAREGTPTAAAAQAPTLAERPVSGTGALAATRVSVAMQRRAIEQARRGLEVAARALQVAEERAAMRRGELDEARALAEGVLSPEEIRAVVILAGVSPAVLGE